MATDKAKLIVLGSDDFAGFKELDSLPPGIEVVGLGTADEMLGPHFIIASLDIQNKETSSRVSAGLGDAKLADVDVLLNTGFGVRADQHADIKKLWPKLTGLKWMHVASAGITHILIDDLKNSDVTLTNAKGAFSHSLAEYAITACLYFAKCLQELKENQAKVSWKPLYVEELRGKKLGIVGYGDIGQKTAAIARVFGMQISALRRRTELSKDEKDAGLEIFSPEQLNELMASSDYIVAALPGTPATANFINAEAIKAMQSHAVFINLGRGTTVDEEALTEALSEHRIKGAGLDVFDTEPLDENSELWKLDNVLLSPHCADRTRTFLDEAVQQFVQNAKLYVEGKELNNICDKQAGY